MPKRKLTDCWHAVVDVRLPISAADPSSIVKAKTSVEELLAALPVGATIEITRAGFGKMAIGQHREELTPQAWQLTASRSAAT